MFDVKLNSSNNVRFLFEMLIIQKKIGNNKKNSGIVSKTVIIAVTHITSNIKQYRQTDSSAYTILS
jgi:hypothetical protein